jgi:hypothetical protein
MYFVEGSGNLRLYVDGFTLAPLELLTFKDQSEGELVSVNTNLIPLRHLQSLDAQQQFRFHHHLLMGLSIQ